MQVDAGLVDIEDARVQRTRTKLLQRALELLGLDHAAVGLAFEQGGEQVGGVDQRILGRFPVARIEVEADAIQQEHDRRDVDRDDAEKDA